MTFVLAQWRERVASAAVRGDAEALRWLYDEGLLHLGHAVASEWATILSAFDAEAVTG
jgi:hypothetical protein